MFTRVRCSGSHLWWEAKVGRSLEARSLRPAWPTWWSPISTKNTKMSKAGWHVPVVPSTQEAEAGESPNPGGGGCNEQRSCHCTPAWETRSEHHLKKQKNVMWLLFSCYNHRVHVEKLSNMKKYRVKDIKKLPHIGSANFFFSLETD